VVLLRDAAAGPEVLLLRRHAKASNMAGVYVFPGGKLDADDATLNPDAHLDQPHAALHERLNEPDTDHPTAAGLHVAALREALEECGLLLAEPMGGNTAVDALRARAMLREGQPFAQVLGALQLRLQTRQLAPWSRWITPLAPTMGTRRFDTRFFVAQAPPTRCRWFPRCRAVRSGWLAPRTSLEQYRDGRIDLAPPQIMSLAHLARHASVASVLQAAHRQRPPLILPEPFDHDGVRVICYPGDAMHPVRERALPGPTRLHYRERRFTPEEGFDALFD
jgi:8-oxo-dGTP pyrophosphatase MutT (NUDIX family)